MELLLLAVLFVVIVVLLLVWWWWSSSKVLQWVRVCVVVLGILALIIIPTLHAGNVEMLPTAAASTPVLLSTPPPLAPPTVRTPPPLPPPTVRAIIPCDAPFVRRVAPEPPSSTTRPVVLTLGWNGRVALFDTTNSTEHDHLEYKHTTAMAANIDPAAEPFILCWCRHYDISAEGNEHCNCSGTCLGTAAAALADWVASRPNAILIGHSRGAFIVWLALWILYQRSGVPNTLVVFLLSADIPESQLERLRQVPRAGCAALKWVCCTSDLALHWAPVVRFYSTFELVKSSGLHPERSGFVQSSDVIRVEHKGALGHSTYQAPEVWQHIAEVTAQQSRPTTS